MGAHPTPDPSVAERNVSPLKNRYYVCPIYSDEPKAWNPRTKDEVLNHSLLAYFGGVFEEMERTLDADELTFYVTWKVDELPSYGSDVVAIVVGDEWGRYPLYTNRVRAVFKMMGTGFPLDANPFHSPVYLTASAALKYARTQLLRLPHLIQARRDRHRGPEWTGGRPVPIFDIPIGYVNQEDLPLKPFHKRRSDVFFSGSLANARYPWYTPQSLLRTPKEVSRRRLVQAMRQLQEERPDLTIDVDVRDAFVPNAVTTQDGSERSYSEMMMDTRICPIPRGTRLETGRLYEALRYGCVIISEPLPDRWFLAGMPTITVHDWAALPQIVVSLLEQPERLEALHRASLSWWNEKCAEAPVGQFLAEKLNGLLRGADELRGTS